MKTGACKRSRLVRLLVLFLIILLMLPRRAPATVPDRSVQKPAEVIGLRYEKEEDDIYYSDGYFSNPATKYNPHLATLSMLMAKYSMNPGRPAGQQDEEWYQNQPNRLKGFFDLIGFEDFDTNDDYRARTGFDTVGVAAARRSVGDSTVIAVAVRSNGYFLEWSNNVWMGDGSNSDQMHEGFYRAAIKELAFLKQYIENRKITGKIQLWMAGFSRGGSVTNLAAGLLDNRIAERKISAFLSDGVTLEHTDLYAYTFEAPQGANLSSESVLPPTDPVYGNIWNVINPNDIIPKLPATEMGFTRFGTDKYITTQFFDPEKFSSNRAVFKAFYTIHNGGNTYSADDFQMYTLTGAKDGTKVNYDANITAIRLFESISDLIGGREGYVKNYQEKAKEISAMIQDDDKNEGSAAMEAFIKELIGSVIEKVRTGEIVTDIKSLFSSEDFDASGTLYPIIGAMIPLVTTVPSELYSFKENFSSIAQNHEPEVILAHILAQDSFYIDAYNANHSETVRVVPLRDNADIGRMRFEGFNDLTLTDSEDAKIADSKGVKVSIQGKQFGKSSVETCEPGFAAGYYSSVTSEKAELFMPADRRYTIAMKSYSESPLHTVRYQAIYRKSGRNQEIRDEYTKSVVFNSDTIQRSVAFLDGV